LLESSMKQPSLNSQPDEPVRKPMGRSRVKPRHLSRILRQSIVDQFAACQSSEDVAEALGIPVRTVTDVLLLHRNPRPLELAVQPYLLRRTA
jgi:hypothetical protein